MKLFSILLITPVAVIDAWSVQTPRKLATQIAKGCATAATCATLLSPMIAEAADGSSVKVNVDFPSLYQLVQTDQSRARTLERTEALASSINNLVGPAISVELPSDLEGVTAKAISGSASLSVNGQNVGVKVVDSKDGSLTFQIANKLIPAIPFGGFDKTPSSVMDVVTDETSFKVDIDSPYLLDLVKTNDARTKTLQKVEFLEESIKDFIGPAVSVELPSDIQNVAKKALGGGASVSINGLDFDVNVVGSGQGYVNIKLSNMYIPAIPFPGLEGSPKFVDAIAESASKVVPAVVSSVVNNANEASTKETSIFDGLARVDIDVGGFSIHKVLTPVDVAGIVSLGLGIAYSSSYAYYRYDIEQAERAAQAKKKAAAEKRAAAAAKKAASVKSMKDSVKPALQTQ